MASRPKQAIPLGDYPSSGPGCLSCAMFIGLVVFIGALVTWLLLKAYALI